MRNVETEKQHSGYTYSVPEAMTIVTLGTFCGLRDLKDIHEWSESIIVREFLRSNFQIYAIPSYYWLTCLLKLVKPASLNECFGRWVSLMLSEGVENLTLAVDGKTVRSTSKMQDYENPLHIVSAHIAELGMTFGQKTVDGKSNEIPAVRELIALLDIRGCVVVADALNCQKETAFEIVRNGADYILAVKGNQPKLHEEIQEKFAKPETLENASFASSSDDLPNGTVTRSAWVCTDLSELSNVAEWPNAGSIGMIKTQTCTKTGSSEEVRYFISSKVLNGAELLYRTRAEWSVEAMHWQLDVLFGEDFCKIHDRNLQQNLNIIRKIVLNHLRQFKHITNDKRPLSRLVFANLLNPDSILHILKSYKN